jgi:hypothetical protein
MACHFSQGQTFTGSGFSMAWPKEAFHGLGVQDVTEFDSD